MQNIKIYLRFLLFVNIEMFQVIKNIYQWKPLSVRSQYLGSRCPGISSHGIDATNSGPLY